MNEMRHHSAGRTAVHMFLGHYSTRGRVVHILDWSDFCVRKTVFPVHNWAKFDHLAVPLGFTSSVHRALNNTETVLLGVFCFPDVALVCHRNVLSCS